ncbi:hypothetical protein KKB44_03230 [Candidatus Micrarchaeota archaeon]|nr:hypothetical protein [Candidatus Micrarchaeota archaeon]
MAKKKSEEDEFKLEHLKKPLRAASLAIAFIGCFILLVLVFIINDAMDKTKNSLLNNLEEARQNMIEMEETLETLEGGLNSTDTALESLQESIEPLSEGLQSTADALNSTGEILSGIEGLGVDMPEEEYMEAAESLKESAQELNETVSAFEEQKTTVNELGEDIGDIKDGVQSQRETLGQTKKSVEDVFELMKLANIFLFFVVVSMFGILILNSIAGLI